jgi:hypothetical protein
MKEDNIFANSNQMDNSDKIKICAPLLCLSTRKAIIIATALIAVNVPVLSARLTRERTSLSWEISVL